MRKVILNLAMSLDGFIEGKNGEIDWCIMDEDMLFGEFLDSVDTLFYGRVSYDAWGNYQPEQNASEIDKQLWESVHSKDKYVFSSQIREDKNALFISSDIINEVNKIKNKQGKDIWLYGGANLIKTFIQLDLIDEYKISIHPIVLGEGKPLFESVKDRISLKLTDSRAFKCGVVELTYVSV